MGTLATVFPSTLLASKGVEPSLSTQVWVREVGVLLVSLGVMTYLLKGEEDTPSLKAFMVGNILIQLGFLPIEAIAYFNGTLTKLSGVAPNTLLHLLLAIGLIYYFPKTKKAGQFARAKGK